VKSPTHLAALEYAARGWAVFPCVPGGKAPLPSHGHKEATTDPAQIDAWWTSSPNANVGIAVAPSNLVVLDVDVGRKKDGTWKHGRTSLTRIEHELAPTLLADTGGLGEDGRPGMHAVYERPAGLEPKRVIDLLGGESGLDLLGEGYIVAAPSFNAETGRYYRWSQPHAIAPLPAFLQNITRAPRPDKVQALGSPIVEGGRNAAMFKLGCALRNTGISAEALARALDAENKARFKPPLEDAELGTIVNHVLRTVQVTHDIAANAIVNDSLQNALGLTPKQGEEWLDNVALTPQPPVLFYPTGFNGLDKLLNGGFATRSMGGLIAPPSTGKSALVGHWILGLEKQRPVLHCSLELPKHELFVRYASHEMHFPWVDGVKGHVDQQAMARSVRGKRIKLMGSDDFDRVDPFGSLEAAAARMTQECGISPFIFIDYIQIMARAASTEMRHKVGELTMRGRQLAQRLDTFVLGVFTTQRDKYQIAAVEKMRQAGDPRAYLGAAKESGDIEFDCAVLMYLDMDMMHKGSPKPGQIALARCRYGDEGFVGLRARLEHGSFVEDPSALAEFASEVRFAKREGEEISIAREALIGAVRAMPGRPWRDVQAKVSATPGVKRRGIADLARDQLVDEGVIGKLDGYDPNTKRKIKGHSYVILESPPPASEFES
jgi:Bifunctional DNA primase/polymerase, N-terminal/DnaB-like helicase C terminal domain/Primase C terminal 1 (PriCT-1)